QGRLPPADSRGGLRRCRGGEGNQVPSRARRRDREWPRARGLRRGSLGHGESRQALSYSKRPLPIAAAPAGKRAGRFSRNARVPSTTSGLSQQIRCASISASRHSASERSTEAVIVRFVRRMLVWGAEASAVARERTSPAKLAWGTTRLTRPMR